MRELLLWLAYPEALSLPQTRPPVRLGALAGDIYRRWGPIPAEQNGSEPTLEERIASEVARLRGQHGYITDRGGYDSEKLAEKLSPPIAGAIADDTKRRSDVAIRQRTLVEHAYPGLPGPESYEQEVDPELAEGVYERLKGDCWRLTAPGGPIMARLNDGLGLVVLRTRVNPDKVWAVYATRDLQCILLDYFAPQGKSAKSSADRDAAVTAAMIERLPEHAKKLHSKLGSNLAKARAGAVEITANAVEVALAESEPAEELQGELLDDDE